MGWFEEHFGGLTASLQERDQKLVGWTGEGGPKELNRAHRETCRRVQPDKNRGAASSAHSGDADETAAPRNSSVADTHDDASLVDGSSDRRLDARRNRGETAPGGTLATAAKTKWHMTPAMTAETRRCEPRTEARDEQARLVGCDTLTCVFCRPRSPPSARFLNKRQLTVFAFSGCRRAFAPYGLGSFF